MPIALQLKSAQRSQDLLDVGRIIKNVKDSYNYKIKGHEIQQLAYVLKQATVSERAKMVSDFCAKNEIEHLSYHTTIFENGENIWDEKWSKEIQDSILQSIEEADMVRKQSGISADAVIIFHLTYYVPRAALPITKEQRLDLQSKTEQAFIRFFEKAGIGNMKGIVLALENLYPRYYPRDAIAGPCHPRDIMTLEKYGVKTVFDMSHYQLYVNYLKYGRESNLLAALDGEIHGIYPPSWSESIKILSDSLVHLHISDAKGADFSGEGLALGQGEIPIRDVLQRVHSLNRNIRGTIELNNGHLDHGRAQLDAARWLINNARDVLY